VAKREAAAARRRAQEEAKAAELEAQLKEDRERSQRKTAADKAERKKKEDEEKKHKQKILDQIQADRKQQPQYRDVSKKSKGEGGQHTAGLAKGAGPAASVVASSSKSRETKISFTMDVTSLFPSPGPERAKGGASLRVKMPFASDCTLNDTVVPVHTALGKGCTPSMAFRCLPRSTTGTKIDLAPTKRASMSRLFESWTSLRAWTASKWVWARGNSDMGVAP